jgi:GNAT superfamily N-acetyltransferase
MVRLVLGLGASACEDDVVTRVRLAVSGDLLGLVEKDRLREDEMTAILGRGRILVAEDGSREGFIGWLRWGLFWDEVPFMNRLHVAEHRRGEGVGRLLVGEWERACGQDGHTTVMTSTVSAESAQHFYRKVGYTDAGCLLQPGESAELFFIKQIA